MYRTAHRGMAALALVLMLTLLGAQPAAAADRSSPARLAGFWEDVLDTVPGARVVVDTLTGWFSSATTQPPPTSDKGWGIDPNGFQVVAPAPPVPPGPA